MEYGIWDMGYGIRDMGLEVRDMGSRLPIQILACGTQIFLDGADYRFIGDMKFRIKDM